MFLSIFLFLLSTIYLCAGQGTSINPYILSSGILINNITNNDTTAIYYSYAAENTTAAAVRFTITGAKKDKELNVDYTHVTSDVTWWTCPKVEGIGAKYITTRVNAVSQGASIPYSIVASDIHLDEITLQEGEIKNIVPYMDVTYMIYVADASKPITIRSSADLYLGYTACPTSIDNSYELSMELFQESSSITIGPSSSVPLRSGFLYITNSYFGNEDSSEGCVASFAPPETTSSASSLFLSFGILLLSLLSVL